MAESTSDIFNTWWQQHFSSRDIVEWGEFQQVLIHHFNLSSLPRKSLVTTLSKVKGVLANGEPSISQTSFLRIAPIFGSFDHLIDEIMKITTKRWFHLYLSVDDAYNKLAYSPAGTYLIRLSKRISKFVASVVIINQESGDREVCHAYISQQDGFYYISQKGTSISTYATLDELLKHSPLLLSPLEVSDIDEMYNDDEIEYYLQQPSYVNQISYVNH